MNAVAGRPPEEYGTEPTKLSEIREGCYDIHERIRDMNANGVAAALNFQACSDENTVINLHIGSSSSVVITSADAPVDTMMTLQPMSIVQAAADLIWSPMLRRFPEVTFALSEGGIGWVPYFLERIDRVYTMHRAWTHQDFGGKLPSEVFLERIALCFIDDGFGVESRHRLNLDMVTWECDYPHSDATWPNSPEVLAGYLTDVPNNEVDKITHSNALRLYSFDMFKHLSKGELTVGALRAQATDVDLGFRSSERLRKTGTDTVTVLDLAKGLPA